MGPTQGARGVSQLRLPGFLTPSVVNLWGSQKQPRPSARETAGRSTISAVESPHPPKKNKTKSPDSRNRIRANFFKNTLECSTTAGCAVYDTFNHKAGYSIRNGNYD